MSTRFKLDENLPRAARVAFLQQGYDAHDVHEEGLASVLDPVLRAACEAEGRVLVTLDYDFSDVRLVSLRRSPDIVLLRPADQSVPSVLECLGSLFRMLGTESVAGCLWIVESGRLRIRRGRLDASGS